MEVGQRLPEILGKDQDGKELKLSDFKGKKLVLYVYPKDGARCAPANSTYGISTARLFPPRQGALVRDLRPFRAAPII